MFLFHPYGKRAAHTATAEPQFHRIAHLRNIRRAAEGAILVGALMLLGFLSAHSPRSPVANWGAGANCVHFGRAGGHCAASVGAAAEKPDSGADCLSLGRAGRFCPRAIFSLPGSRF